ncbi:hypothetical protein [Methanobacterium ferruginis]|uniref:hypothetical protein n=1 Tax=Methanobacterium ferruginis TaxID=710191 RepID=UPI0025737F32|nr:hypothetical protein [Methanobacterium ferruginis]BDZ68931.1 hypothetical protein GCM10025860_23790 [Methanobacterium ferruginis]
MKRKETGLILLFLIIIIIVIFVFYYPPTSSEVNNTQNHSINQINASLSTPFQLKINQTAVLESGNIRITLLNITEDSRCPEGAVCVWAGQVKALFLLEVNQSNQEIFNLTLNFNETQSQKTSLGYMIKILKVEPYPKANRNKNLNNYEVTLVITPQTSS